MGAEIEVRKEETGKIIVSFPYNHCYIAKVKTIPLHRWHPDKKYCSFPNNNGTLEKILKVFKGEKVYIDSAPQAGLSPNVIARQKNPLDSLNLKNEKNMTKYLNGEGKRLAFSQRRGKRNISSIIPKQDKKRSTSLMNELGEITCYRREYKIFIEVKKWTQ